MSGIKATAVAKYMILPGIIPRLRRLLTSGFGYIAFLMAQIYAMVRLLPPHHPYLNPQNIGRFGIRNVLVETSNLIVLKRENIDQIVVFFLMLAAIVILALQIIVLAFGVLFSSAFAGSIFVTPTPDGDIAYMLLDQVFGIGPIGGTPFFNSCVAAGTTCPGALAPSGPFPWPFHLALQNLFRFYSLGILAIGTAIFLYFVLVVVVETAATGTPFGQRFQNAWVPIRLVVALGLLIPLSWGYNSGQYITFAAAKFGSSLATNAWISYNNQVNGAMGGTGNPMGEDENLIAMPRPPDGAVFAQIMSLVHSCAFIEYLRHPNIVKGGPATAPSISVNYPDPTGSIGAYLNNRYAVKPWFVKTPSQVQIALGGLAAQENRFVSATTTYDQAMQFYTGSDIKIVFGRKPADTETGSPGNVKNVCGEITIPITDRRPTNTGNVHTGTPSDGYLGTVALQRYYFELIQRLWFDSTGGTIGLNENYIDFAGRVALMHHNPTGARSTVDHSGCRMGCQGTANPNLPIADCGTAAPAGITPDTRDCSIQDPDARWKQDAVNTLQTEINTQLNNIWTAFNAGTNQFDLDPALLDRGWAGAGIWFNSLANVNGAFIAAALNVPTMTIYPAIMEKTRKLKNQKDSNASALDQFNPNISEGEDVKTINLNGAELTKSRYMSYIFDYWNKDAPNAAQIERAPSAGALETGMNLVFGTHGLFSMVDENANIHPLAQLVALGKGLVESAIRNVAGASIAAAMGGVVSAFDTTAGPLISAAGSFLNSTAFVGLTAGFVLFYVLPFLPFVFFFFAVASWVKAIFEAMVGVPLWALAHLRLDGEGLPGDSASNGYFLIFEIFIRPIITLFGLIAAMVIFTAQVRILNFIWMLVTENVGGFNNDSIIAAIGNVSFKRSIIDEFFFTVIYAIIVYMLATSSFKLIDKIPDDLLRWMGAGVNSFGDINQDPTENLTRYAALGGMTAGREAAGGVQSLAGGMGGSFGRSLAGVIE